MLALGWAFRNGQFENFEQGSQSIFGPDEPVGEATDAFPGEPTVAGSQTPARPLRGRPRPNCDDDTEMTAATAATPEARVQAAAERAAIDASCRGPVLFFAASARVLAARRVGARAHRVDQAAQPVLPHRQRRN